MTTTVYHVAGRPAPQGSKRHIGGGRMVESSRHVGPWREAVRAETQRVAADTAAGPVAVRIDFGLPRPKSHFRTGHSAGVLRPDAPIWHAQTPDLDKLVRATLDGLADGGAFSDDKLVARLATQKRWSRPGERPGATIWVEEL